MGAVLANKILHGLGSNITRTGRIERGREANEDLGVLALTTLDIADPCVIGELIAQVIASDSIAHLVVVKLDKESIELSIGNQIIVLVRVATFGGNDTFRGSGNEQLGALLAPPVDHGNIRLIA